MTYMVRSPKRIAPRPRGALGGFYDIIDSIIGVGPVSALRNDLAQASSSPACLDAATSQTVDFDAKTNDLAKTWRPNGFYKPSEVKNLVGSTLELLRQGTAALDAASSSGISQAARDAIQMVRSQTQDKFGQSLAFTQAVGQAMSSGSTTIDAPGLKNWIVTSMSAASVAINSAAFVSCEKPWWISALAMFQSAFDVLYAVCKAIVGAVVKVGELIVSVPDTVGTILTYAKWGALIGGAAFLVYEFDKMRKS